jgi:hypothetical protein
MADVNWTSLCFQNRVKGIVLYATFILYVTISYGQK